MAIRWRQIGKEVRALMLIYGPTGVGKTVSIIKSVPYPAMYFECEERAVETTCRGNIDLAKMEQEGQFIRGHVDSLQDLAEELNTNEETIIKTYRSIVTDSFTYLMNVKLLREIQIESGESGIFDGPNVKKRPMVNMARTDPAGYGALASYMQRITESLGRFASAGLVVVVTALESDNPKWNRGLAAAPNFAGKEYGKTFPGAFDFIGRAERRIDGREFLTGSEGEPVENENYGKVVYPPRVYFESDEEESFMAKWSGPKLDKSYMNLNITKILNYQPKGST